jgi:precorrin-4 methylase
MKKLTILTIAAAMVMSMPSFASAQTISGTLTVSATVNSSITLTFQKNASGFAIGNPNTGAATMGFGPVQAFGGAAIGGVTQTLNANSFTLTTPVDVVVNAANNGSANYKLTAQLQAPPSNGQTFTVNALSISTSAQNINPTATYGTTTVTVAETIPFAVPNSTTLTDVITFTATAN